MFYFFFIFFFFFHFFFLTTGKVNLYLPFWTLVLLGSQSGSSAQHSRARLERWWWFLWRRDTAGASGRGGVGLLPLFFLCAVPNLVSTGLPAGAKLL